MINPIVNPLDDWDDLPESHARIGYGNLLVSADDTNGSKALTVNTYERMETDTGAFSMDFQLIVSANIDYIAIGAHNLSGETFTLQYATTIGGSYTDIIELSPTSNGAIMYQLPEALEVAEIRMTGTFSESKEIGVIQAGIALQMYQPIYGGHTPIDLSASTVYESNNSELGQFLGRTIVRNGLDTNYSFRYLKEDWVRERFKPFMVYARENPFFIKWRPDLYETTAYGYTTADLKPMNMGGNPFMSVDFNMRAHADL